MDRAIRTTVLVINIVKPWRRNAKDYASMAGLLLACPQSRLWSDKNNA